MMQSQSWPATLTSLVRIRAKPHPSRRRTEEGQNSAIFAGVGLPRCRDRFRLGALLRLFLGRGLFGVPDGLETFALATFELVVRFACHGPGLSVTMCAFDGALLSGLSISSPVPPARPLRSA